MFSKSGFSRQIWIFLHWLLFPCILSKRKHGKTSEKFLMGYGFPSFIFLGGGVKIQHKVTNIYKGRRSMEVGNFSQVFPC